MTQIQKEISEQPTVLARLLKEGSSIADRIAAAIRDFNPAFALIAARGTSDNAGRYAQYMLGIHAGLPVGLATPSIHTLYDSPPRLSHCLVIAISQSGQSQDVRQVITDANSQGALTVAITNDPESPLATSAQYHLPLMAEKEVSVAATKTYTAELCAIAMLVAALADKPAMRESLTRLPQLAADTLLTNDQIGEWADRYRYMDRLAVIGRGYNYATAFEVSLKIKELCYITAVEYSEADFRHGPIALVQGGYPVLVVAPEGKPLPLLLDLLDKLKEKRAERLVISNSPEAVRRGVKAMNIPVVPEWMSPLLAVIPGQLFAMHVAIAKGHEVDRPIGLTKVTNTE